MKSRGVERESAPVLHGDCVTPLEAGRRSPTPDVSLSEHRSKSESLAFEGPKPDEAACFFPANSHESASCQ